MVLLHIKAAMYSTYKQKVYYTKNRCYFLLLKELPLESLEGVRVDGKGKISL